MKKLIFILLTLFSLQSFAQDTIYVRPRGIPGAYNFSKNDSGDSLIFYVAGVRHALSVGSTVDLSNYYNKGQIDDSLATKLSASYEQSITAIKPLHWNVITPDSATIDLYVDTTSDLSDGSDTTVPSTRVVKNYVDNHLQTLDFLNVLDYGAVADSSTLCADAINAAINIQYSKGGGTVLIPPGKYIIDKAIKLKDNVTLIATNADIYLKPGSNDYMVRNYDFYNGNKNISVIGGTWHANGAGQTMNITDSLSLDTDFYGFGFVFCRVNNLLVQDLEIDSTITWGIAHFVNDFETYKNIKFRQAWSFHGNNSDGITGNGNHILIDNISGYTNDDLVAINMGSPASFGGKGFPNGYWPSSKNANDIIINNIHGEQYDSLHTANGSWSWRLVRLFAINGDTISNAHISNITGFSNSAPIIITSHYPIIAAGDGVISNVSIDNVNVQTMGTLATSESLKGYIRFDGNTPINSINISNVVFNNGKYNNYPAIGLYDSHISSININNLSSTITGVVNCPIIEDSLSRVASVNLTNIFVNDTSLSAKPTLYRKYADTGYVTRITASNILLGNDSLALIKNTTAKLSLKTLAFRSDTTKLTGQEGDVVYQKDFGLVNFENGKWNYGTGGSVGNADSLGGYPAASYYIKTAVDALLAAKADDNLVAHLTGTETFTGIKTFTANPVIQSTTGVASLSAESVYNGFVHVPFSAKASRGTLSSALPLLNGDLIGYFAALGNGVTGGSPSYGTSIGVFGFYAAADFTATSKPTYFSIQTTPTGSISAVDRVHVEQDGTLKFLSVNDAAGDFLTRNSSTGAITRRTASEVRTDLSLTITGTAAPTVTPAFVGQEFIDTTNKKAYKAMGTTSSADWVLLN